jgi:energy-coupling factor transport system permease protein
MSPLSGGMTPDEALTGLHPAFRILLLLVLAAVLFQYSLAALGIVLALVLFAAAADGRETLAGILKALRRIRWLLLSIVVFYLWIAPEPGPSGGSAWLPSWQELDIALRRSGVLVVLVAAVELLRRRTGAPHMAAGLVMLLQPLAWLGLEVEVFARRLALTLEAVPLTAERVAGAAGGRRPGLAGWGDAAAALVRDVEQDAMALPPAARLPLLSRPGLRDWLLLGGGVAACLLLARLP